jgi:methionyl aminopeptidase
VLKDGDIVGLDLGAIVGGFYGDSAVTIAVGRIDEKAATLVRVTEESLSLAIQQARVGNRLSDISHAVQQHVETAGYSVVTEFVGHGIGRQLHEEPQVPNYGKPGQGPRLQPGMVLAIEPMVNMGGSAVRVLDDRWTAVTVDGSLSAHFEHTIAIQPSGPALVLSRL